MNKLVATIEIPSGSRFKYELKNDKLVLDRINTLSIPTNYGSLNSTLSADSDPSDCFVYALNEPLNPLCEVEVEPFALIKTLDNNVEDHKFVASLVELNKSCKKQLLDMLVEYLSSYKKTSKVQEVILNKKLIDKEIKKCQLRYKESLLNEFREES